MHYRPEKNDFIITKWIFYQWNQKIFQEFLDYGVLIKFPDFFVQEF